jgi:hypothetical protein
MCHNHKLFIPKYNKAHEVLTSWALLYNNRPTDVITLQLSYDKYPKQSMHQPQRYK